MEVAQVAKAETTLRYRANNYFISAD